jgi:sugar phosphate isomerase/epimerase
MRYGVMAVQAETLMPPGAAVGELLKKQITLDYAGLVRQVVRHGFHLIELSADFGMIYPPAFEPKSIRRLNQLRERLGLSYTVHLPFWSLEPSTPLDEIRRAAVRTLVDAIHVCRVLEPEVYVLHATGEMASDFYTMDIAHAARSFLMRKFQSHAKASIEAILAQTGIPARKLAVETIHFPFDLTLELAEELGVSICLDTGHVLAGYSGPVELFDALEVCLPHLAEVHLHDSPWQGPAHILRDGEDHRTLGLGDLDVARFLARLDASRFDGPVIFELNTSEALQSLAVIENLARQQVAV